MLYSLKDVAGMFAFSEGSSKLARGVQPNAGMETHEGQVLLAEGLCHSRCLSTSGHAILRPCTSSL